MKISLRQIGKPHQVRCDLCGLKLECKCRFDKGIRLLETHSIVACPRCQMAGFLYLFFGRGKLTPSQVDLARKYFIDAAMRARDHARKAAAKRGR
ncbi:MAG: hypothetical protein ACREQI_05160 [Candidatus Binataceae bacterium]